MGVDLGTFLQHHPEYLPDKYKFMRFDGIDSTVLSAIFQALPPEIQRAYRAQLGYQSIDQLPDVMEGGLRSDPSF
ncbi:MAG: hypothetical protein AAB612_03795 [Patescibacteria group bacterium]